MIQSSQSSATPAPRWKRRKEARPSEIVAAALEVFVEHGYAGARLEDVARRAGITKGTMYLYFPSKEALFKEMVRHTMLPAIERGERLLEGHCGTARELLQRFMEGWWDYLLASPASALPKIMISEAGKFPELARFYHEEVILRARRLTMGVLKRGIESGEFRPVDVEYTARLLGAPLILAAIWKYSLTPCESAPLDPARYRAAWLEVVLTGLLPGGRSEAPPCPE